MSIEIEFESFPKLMRLRRGIIVTEKIDGTNARTGTGDRRMSMFKGMKEAEQTKGQGKYIDPGQHVFQVLGHTVRESKDPKKGLGKKFFIAELLTLQSSVHEVGSKRSWLVDFSKGPLALGNLKNYGYAIFPALNNKITREILDAIEDDDDSLVKRGLAAGSQTTWDGLFAWLCGPENPVRTREVKLRADAAYNAAKTFTRVDWSTALDLPVAASAAR